MTTLKNYQKLKTKISLVILFFIFHSFSELYAANDNKRFLQTSRVKTSIKIDGVLDEADWATTDIASDFTTYSPSIGAKAMFDSEVRLVYSDEALYIGAKLFDAFPQKILTHLSKRDEYALNSDAFWITLSPFNDGQNYFKFKITAANVQSDMMVSSSGEDSNWNAVWESEVKYTDKGWIVEIKIPYSEIRFPKLENQKWGINFWRELRREKEVSCWNPVDRNIGEWQVQSGVLEAVNNISPPVRLSLYPYLSAVVDKTKHSTEKTFSGGMDLKYGINNSFTLDATLVPDFSQTKSDNKELNLTPYELKFNENRAFFTEGTELFNKAGIFYTRRIGNSPSRLHEIRSELTESDSIIEFDDKEKLINATKISGRTNFGLGIGFFNAMVNPTYLKKKDKLTGEISRIKTQEFTNYNMMVLDQTIGRYSYFNLSNTNRNNKSEMDDVLASAYKFANKDNTYAIHGKAGMSFQKDKKHDKKENGSFIDASIGKINGALKYSYNLRLVSDDYDQNAMGYLSKNNELKHVFNLKYNCYEKSGILMDYRASFTYENERMYKDNLFSKEKIKLDWAGTFLNYLSVGAWWEYVPRNIKDYRETRNSNRFILKPKENRISAWISSDYRKILAIDADGGIAIPENSFSKLGYTAGKICWYSIKPMIRISRNFRLSHDFDFSKNNNEYGYFGTREDHILFGKRDVTKYENKFEANYIFNNKSYLGLNLRHYWSKVKYKKLLRLDDEGMLNSYNMDEELKNRNYNSFNIDLSYSYNFAPGSFLNLMWKNDILSMTDNIDRGFADNLKDMFDQDQLNSFSLKISYYINYNKIKKRTNQKSKIS
ncbi:MAG: carbohydrate binding family 9 domain-containing protein [Marinifilaceae bacterium]|jgi:hypothetical protein|nr:carbohydrate binding family 9 domain-containing protein [Marinifilaceae bacterium]